MALYRDIPQLRRYLSDYIGSCDPKRHKIAFICGHFPIVRNPFTGKFYPATEPFQKGFGYFTEGTANLGANLMWGARMKGFKADIALIGDDHKLVGEPEWFFFLNMLAGCYAKKSGGSVPAQKVFSKEERARAAVRYAEEHPGSELAKILNGMVEVHRTYTLPNCLTRHLISETDIVLSKQSGHLFSSEQNEGAFIEKLKARGLLSPTDEEMKKIMGLSNNGEGFDLELGKHGEGFVHELGKPTYFIDLERSKHTYRVEMKNELNLYQFGKPFWESITGWRSGASTLMRKWAAQVRSA